MAMHGMHYNICRHFFRAEARVFARRNPTSVTGPRLPPQERVTRDPVTSGLWTLFPNKGSLPLPLSPSLSLSLSLLTEERPDFRDEVSVKTRPP